MRGEGEEERGVGVRHDALEPAQLVVQRRRLRRRVPREQPRQVPPNLRRRTGPDRFGPGRVWSGPVRVWAGFGSVRASLIGPVRAGPVRLSVVP